jgi:hypothetical protein
MTDPVCDPVEPEPSSEAAASGEAAAHDALVQQFDTEVAPALETFGLAAAGNPQRALRQLYETGEEVDPQAPRVRRILQRLAAGVIECQLMARFASLHFQWPDAQAALAHPDLCRAIAGVGRQEIDRAGEMLFAAIMSAARETAPDLGDKFDAEMWADVLTEVLRPQRPAAGDACEIPNIASLRLIRDARRGHLVGGFSGDDPDDAA